MAAETAISAPQQHKQPSRKGKRAWRKNVDIDEIQRGMEDAREEETTHGGVIVDLPSTSLFTTDIAGSGAIQRAYNKQNKPLKSHEILAQRSAVPAVSSRKRAASPVRKKARTADYVPHRELERLRDIALGRGDGQGKNVQHKDGGADYDPWAVEGPAKATSVAREDDSFLEPEQLIRAPETLRRAPVVLTANGVAPAAVKRPDPGRSYNPVFVDWDNLYTREGEKAVETEKIRLQAAQEELERETKVREVAEEVEQAEKEAEEWGDEESEWEGFRSEVDDEQEWLGKPVEVKRKTKAERNRIARRKEDERAREAERKRKEKEKQVAMAKALTKDVEQKRNEDLQELVIAPEQPSEDEAEEELLRRKAFGKISVPNAPLELVLPEELQESLRLLKPEGNLLTDRYRNMVIGGKIEARRRIGQVKKPRRTVTEKWSYKDWKLPPAR